ncbi:MAG TPA: ABC transporter permease subunit [Steroidobacteraceae bacterium]|nr:ABC transporter permease subunit [Steroidobacteraceae bacterium]
MLRYALRRLSGFLPTLFVIVTVSFFVIRLAPGGPFEAEQGLRADVRANLEAAYGLNRPLWAQYGRYVGGVLHGDFGPSLKLRDVAVSELIARGLPLSAGLGFAAMALALLAGVGLGLAAALKRGGLIDHATGAFAVLGVSLPGFVVGPFLALVFGLYLHWLPVAGWQPDFAHAVLPLVTLALPVAAYIARLTRGSALEVLRSDYVRTARAKGLSAGRIVLHHVLRPALLPVVSYLGPAVAAIVTGSLVVESVFGLPGTGRYLAEGALNRDYSLVMGMVIVYGTLTLGCNLLADLAYGWLDPRVRYE